MEGPSIESLPRSDATESTQRVDNKENLTDPKTMSKSNDTTKTPGSSLQTVPKTPPKNGIPPKRMSTSINRRPAAASAAPSRVNTSTSSHTNPESGLSKPPTRPLASSSARRPTAGVTAVTAANSGHKKRPSVTTFDSKSKGEESASEENTKSSASQPENRAPKSDSRKPATSWTPANSKSSLSQGSNENTSQQSTKTSTKTALRPATNGSRPVALQSTSHTTRPISSSVRSAMGASRLDTRKKRLSTIPASPAVERSETFSSNQGSSPKPVKTSRPTLGSRKSTMSVTIEQRLREMELVHQMIQIAMAEGGDESDEVKEEYGKRVDESLASLRTKLEEARWNEGLGFGEPKIGANAKAPETTTSRAETSRSASDPDKFPTAFTESQSEGAKPNVELAALQSKILERYVHPNEALNHILETTQRLRKHLVSELANLTICHNVQVYHTHEGFAEKDQEGAEKLRATHVSEVTELIATHQSELAAAGSRLDEAESRFKEHLAQSVKDLEEAKRVITLSSAKETKATLNRQLENQSTAVEALERQLSDERSSRVDANSRIQNLLSELSGQQELLSETNKKHINILRKRDEDHIAEKKNSVATKDREISELHREIRLLQTTHSAQLEEARSSAIGQCSALQSELVELRKELDHLKVERQADSTTHNENMESKNREIHTLGKVIEDLQNLTQQTNEAKERAIDKVKIDLIVEHDKIVSDLHRIQREETHAMALAQEARRKDQSISLERAESKVIELKHMLELSESALEAAEATNEDFSETVNALELKVHALESERDEVEAGKASTDKALQQLSGEFSDLKKSLETLRSESQSKDEQHQSAVRELRIELDSTTKALESKSIERSSYSEKLAEELDAIRQSHALDMKEIQKSSEGALQDLQNSYDNLLVTSRRSEEEHSIDLEKAKSELKEVLGKHAQDLENLERTHSKDMDELKSHAEKTAKAEKKYQGDIDELQQQHQKRYISLRDELERAGLEKTLLAQTAHETSLSALQSQLQHHKELLAEAEEQLRMVKESHDKSSAAKFEELNSQLEKAQAEAAQAKREITSLVAAAKEASDALSDTTELDRLRQELFVLKKQHAAEISKVQENMELESEKRERERKQGAEVRDRLVAESERLRHELLQGAEARDRLVAESERLRHELVNTIQMANEHQTATHVSAGLLQEANQKMSTARHVADRHKSEHRKVLEELRAAQGQIEELKSARSQMEAERSPDVNQEFEALKVDLADARQNSAKLEERLREDHAVHATRIREMESALKVTTAELVELKTERPNGCAVAASPALKSGLRSSRWAIIDNDKSSDGDTKEGEELGSLIEGNMAGMQEQLRQLEDFNEDMIDESQRFLNRMQGTIWFSTPDPAVGNEETKDEEEL